MKNYPAWMDEFQIDDPMSAYILMRRLDAMTRKVDCKLDSNKLRHILEVGFNALAEQNFNAVFKEAYGDQLEANISNLLAKNLNASRVQCMANLYMNDYMQHHGACNVLDAICDTLNHMDFWRQRAILPLLALVYGLNT